MTDTDAARAARVGYRGRFAPSPTGPLHFGSLVAAVASYADALAAGGEWLLRIEDVDLPRARPGAADAILRTLEALGFAWNGPVWRQSDRTSSYAAALDRLRAQGLAYPCACTRAERAHDTVGRLGERIYPGTCAKGLDAARTTRARLAIRVRTPTEPIAFVDRRFGAITQTLATDVGDFIVRRSDGLFAYQLAVVVDDAAQGISDVVRGADLLASTPRQIFLQRALGLPTLRYLHVPVAIDAHGHKLSKQAGASAVRGSPLVALNAAWRFLDQPAPDEDPADIGEFWALARAHWRAERVPPSLMLPAPALV